MGNVKTASQSRVPMNLTTPQCDRPTVPQKVETHGGQVHRAGKIWNPTVSTWDTIPETWISFGRGETCVSRARDSGRQRSPGLSKLNLVGWPTPLAAWSRPIRISIRINSSCRKIGRVFHRSGSYAVLAALHKRWDRCESHAMCLTFGEPRRIIQLFDNCS